MSRRKNNPLDLGHAAYTSIEITSRRIGSLFDTYNYLGRLISAKLHLRPDMTNEQRKRIESAREVIREEITLAVDDFDKEYDRLGEVYINHKRASERKNNSANAETVDVSSYFA